MKKIFLFTALAAVSVFQSCEGPEGPQGPAGDDGLIAEAFEVTTSFVDDPDPYFAFRSFFPLDPAIYASDSILVYELSGVEDGLDVWKPLPQVYYTNTGSFQYNFDFTTNDFSIFIDATPNIDRNTIDSFYRNNVTFRIVIVPGYFSRTSATQRLKIPEYYDVMQQYGLDESDVKTLPQTQK
ncbi:hypothetical protein [Flavobacterium silvaticum]|uniref:Collagen-like protein n=1 Tax=Flavobacterium silvaticum TaxID=1852020 RepID=A0A972FLD4_9FLAO|nr:hypothetical protein [Flavobacterium silvaticum]NMH27797.1 hypothetical protein [Flavobacterium silvaticum]